MATMERPSPHELEAALRTVVYLPRHRGRTLREVLMSDVEYVRWMGTRARLQGRLREAVDVVWRAYGKSLGPREDRA